VLVVHGELDPICPAAASRALASSVPGARHVELAGTGHAPFLSAPDRFHAALASFLEAVA
jgi:pimeloyl-[acyl-carrier protein] methyl ester esterase